MTQERCELLITVYVFTLVVAFLSGCASTGVPESIGANENRESTRQNLNEYLGCGHCVPGKTGGVYKYVNRTGTLFFTDCEVQGENCELVWHRKPNGDLASKPTTKTREIIKPRQIVLNSTQLVAVKNGVGNRLKDPYSARYHSIQSSVDNSQSRQRVLVCGMVNAKNEYGGYVGKAPFAGYLDTDNTFRVLGIGYGPEEYSFLRKICGSITFGVGKESDPIGLR